MYMRAWRQLLNKCKANDRVPNVDPTLVADQFNFGAKYLQNGEEN